MNDRLQYRMYFFVPYNISPIQQAIQAGHAALEYAVNFQKEKDFEDFAFYDKTWIILNGGTTNSSLDGEGNPIGSLNIIKEDLWTYHIKYSLFYEIDLNNALTAICFLADERVWDYENYPDFPQYLAKFYENEVSAQRIVQLRMTPFEELKETYADHYEVWFNKLGGEKNLFLRDLIRNKKLA